MLINLEVYNAEISPIFDCNNLTYTVNVNNNINKLDLFTEPQEGYEVNIIGNNDLKEGENTILIEVSNSIELNKGNNRYQLYLRYPRTFRNTKRTTTICSSFNRHNMFYIHYYFI